MINNWKITAYLKSPLAENPPMFDSILEWELARRLGMKHSNKLTRNIPLDKIQRPPIPLVQRTIEGKDVYACSDPILPVPFSEWNDYQSKRFDSDIIALLVKDSERKSVLTSSGQYKNRFVPIRIRLVSCIVWFVRGDKKEINKLLKSVIALGKYRNIGYGLIDHWEYEKTENDNSIFVLYKNKKVLMKTIPSGSFLKNYTGYKKSFGGGHPPYWHPDTYMEIAIPC